VTKIKQLINSYSKYIAIPWRSDAAAAQRVIFCIYSEKDELRLRARIDEFEIVTRQSGHGWMVFDLTDTFPKWLASQKYAKSYFKKPEHLYTLLPNYLAFITDRFEEFLGANSASENTVVALKGVGSLFGF